MTIYLYIVMMIYFADVEATFTRAEHKGARAAKIARDVRYNRSKNYERTCRDMRHGVKGTYERNLSGSSWFFIMDKKGCKVKGETLANTRISID